MERPIRGTSLSIVAIWPTVIIIAPISATSSAYTCTIAIITYVTL